MKSIISSIILICFVTLNFAQGVDGKWHGVMNTPTGVLNLTFNFLAKGEVLTGDVTSERGVLPLQKGKVTGDEISFEVFTDGMQITSIGKVVGNKIKLSSKELKTEIELTKVTEESKINGSWLGKVSGPEGEMEIIFTFKVEGEKLTGTNKSVMGTLDLLNGKVTGDEFTFDIDLAGTSINHKCKYAADDTIDVNGDVMGQEIQMKLTRVK